jgi:hypothetical protein
MPKILRFLSLKTLYTFLLSFVKARSGPNFLKVLASVLNLNFLASDKAHEYLRNLTINYNRILL